MAGKKERNFSPLQSKMHEIIFEADTQYGKVFDIFLIIFIALSILVVNLERCTVNSKQLWGILKWP